MIERESIAKAVRRKARGYRGHFAQVLDEDSGEFITWQCVAGMARALKRSLMGLRLYLLGWRESGKAARITAGYHASGHDIWRRHPRAQLSADYIKGFFEVWLNFCSFDHGLEEMQCSVRSS